MKDKSELDVPERLNDIISGPTLTFALFGREFRPATESLQLSDLCEL